MGFFYFMYYFIVQITLLLLIYYFLHYSRTVKWQCYSISVFFIIEKVISFQPNIGPFVVHLLTSLFKLIYEFLQCKTAFYQFYSIRSYIYIYIFIEKVIYFQPKLAISIPFYHIFYWNNAEFACVIKAYFAACYLTPGQ